MATPLLAALVAMAAADLVFSLDSIPAVYAVTSDPFIVFTSNIFAMLGLRSLYFLLAGVIERFAYLKVGLSLILVFVGLKMLASDLYHVPTLASLGIIVGILAASMAASLVRRRPAADQRATTTSQGEGPVTYGHGVEPPNGVVRAPGFDDASPPRGTASRNPLRPEAQRVRRDPIRGRP